MKTITIAAAAILCASCADTGFNRMNLPISERILTNPGWWKQEYNPLNKPGDDGELPTAKQLHRGNIRAITDNPVYGLWDELHENWQD